MKVFHLLALGFFLGNISCNLFRSSSTKWPGFHSIDKPLVVGHRGEAAHLPENSIEGFLSAVAKGVDALELDVVVSADQKVVVSHEPFMASHYMLDPAGKSIPKGKQLGYNLYHMPYDSIRRFDSGTKWNKKFPHQKKISTYKPLLAEVIDSVENFTTRNSLKPVTYMVEIKSSPDLYGTFQPEPQKFADLVMQVISEKRIEKRIVVKSFDPNLLNLVRLSYPEVPISFLVTQKGIKQNLSRLDFTPEIYSPRHKLIKKPGFVDSVQEMNMQLIPWTVNKRRHIKKMLNYGVDGIITDRPERVLKILHK